jgi:hypothetical protein
MRATASFASAIAASSTASPEPHDTSGLQAAAALAVSERSKCTIASTATGAIGNEIEKTSINWRGPSVHGVHASPAAPLARSWPSIRPASPTARNSPETMPGGNRSFARSPSAPSELASMRATKPSPAATHAAVPADFGTARTVPTRNGPGRSPRGSAAFASGAGKAIDAAAGPLPRNIFGAAGAPSNRRENVSCAATGKAPSRSNRRRCFPSIFISLW